VRGWLRGATLPIECDGINVQMTHGVEPSGGVRAQLVDFGHFEMRARFVDPLVSLVSNQVLRWGAAVWPDHPAFVTPSLALCVPEAKWGFATPPAAGAKRPRRSEGEGPFRLAHTLARGPRLPLGPGHRHAGSSGAGAFRRRFDRPLAELTALRTCSAGSIGT
jgi:hypothetical protein